MSVSSETQGVSSEKEEEAAAKVSIPRPVRSGPFEREQALKEQAKSSISVNM